jgi:hypothetical protein
MTRVVIASHLAPNVSPNGPPSFLLRIILFIEPDNVFFGSRRICIRPVRVSVDLQKSAIANEPKRM